MTKHSKAGIASRVRNGVMAGAVGLSSLVGTASYAQPGPGADLAYVNPPALPIPLPEKLTQQTDDFYKTPRNEFDMYRATYLALAKDGLLDGKDIEGLEYVLNKTLKEIDGKLFNQHGELRESLPRTPELESFIRHKKEMEIDLEELREHLRLRDEWSQTHAARGNFWNYGLGTRFYIENVDNGNVSDSGSAWPLEGVDRRVETNPAYKTDTQLFLNQGFQAPRIVENWEENPAKTRINYWLGLAAGIAVPILTTVSGIKRNERRKKLTDERIAIHVTHGILNPLSGYLLLDSVHPLVYPIRVGVPILYEAARWTFGKNPAKSNKSTAGETQSTTMNAQGGTVTIKGNSPKRVDNKATGMPPISGPELPNDFIDPWKVKIAKGGAQDGKNT